jgi:hypothetical protein
MIMYRPSWNGAFGDGTSDDLRPVDGDVEFGPLVRVTPVRPVKPVVCVIGPVDMIPLGSVPPCCVDGTVNLPHGPTWAL